MKDNNILYLIMYAAVWMHSTVYPMHDKKEQCSITIPVPETHVLLRTKSVSGVQHSTQPANSDSDSEDNEIVVKHRPPRIYIEKPLKPIPRITQSTSRIHRHRSNTTPSRTV